MQITILTRVRVKFHVGSSVTFFLLNTSQGSEEINAVRAILSLPEIFHKYLPRGTVDDGGQPPIPAVVSYTYDRLNPIRTACG